jgi:uncharacterized membrane protein YkgB
MLISILAVVATFFVPIGSMADETGVLQMTPYGVQEPESGQKLTNNNYYFYAPLTVALVLTIRALLAFRNRKSQIMSLKLTFLLFAATFVLMALYVNDVQSSLQGMKFALGIGFFLPLAATALNWLAARAIKKDEELIKSVDRIR